MKRWFTSDIHFDHKNVIAFCNRPWTTKEEMNEGLIANFNALIAPEDEVYCLGDFSLSYGGAEFVKRLNGKWHLIPGNHDKVHSTQSKSLIKMTNSLKRYEEMGFYILPENYFMEITSNKSDSITVQVNHFPFKEDHGNFEYTPRYEKLRPKPIDDLPLLHGHVHSAWKTRYYNDNGVKTPQINLGVDVWDWKPVSEEELYKLLISLKV